MFSNKNVSEEILTKENLFKYISEYDVYNYYVPKIRLGRTYHSPLRQDKNPSFGIFVASSGELCWNDYAIGGGNCVKLTALIENISYYEALDFLNNLFKVGLTSLNVTGKSIKPTKTVEATNHKITNKSKPKISIQARDWLTHDIEYFDPLDHKKIKAIPIKFFWIDDQLFNTDKYAYAWRYGKNIYKIYQPMLDISKGKWWSNISNKVNWFGTSGLDINKSELFICSSNKDASVLHQIGFNAIAPHTEAQTFSKSQYEMYSKYFDRVIIFYDNDERGIQYAEKFSNQYNLDYIYLEEPNTKDPFEFIKEYTLEDLYIWVKETI